MLDNDVLFLNRLERDPNSLLRLLILVSVISILLVLSLTGYGIYRNASEEMRLAAEDDAIRVTTVMVEEHYEYLFSSGEGNVALSQTEIDLFINKIRKFLHPFGIVKIKVTVNDTYGHQTGDDILRELSKRVRACLREYDVFGRYGGEEFLVVVPDGDFKGTMVEAERIRFELNKAPFDSGGHKLSITASFGVTCCLDPDEGINTALRRADEALYKAKNEGRNRVVGIE